MTYEFYYDENGDYPGGAKTGLPDTRRGWRSIEETRLQRAEQEIRRLQKLLETKTIYQVHELAPFVDEIVETYYNEDMAMAHVDVENKKIWEFNKGRASDDVDKTHYIYTIEEISAKDD